MNIAWDAHAEPYLYGAGGGGSGGFLHYTLHHMARCAFNLDLQAAPDLYDVRAVRRHGSDYAEHRLLHPDTREPLLTMATCYGFRHIQNLVRKLKKTPKKRTSNETYDYVEVMACPSGT